MEVIFFSKVRQKDNLRRVVSLQDRYFDIRSWCSKGRGARKEDNVTKKKTETIVSELEIFMKILSNLVRLVKKSGGKMENIHSLATSEGSARLEEIARIIARKGKEGSDKFLEIISSKEELVLDEYDGKEILANAGDVFGYLDPDLIRWGTDKKGPATGKTPIAVYEMARNGTFAKLFGSLNEDVHKLCLTQAQIRGFVLKYRKWLRAENYVTFFLFRSSNKMFVAGVMMNYENKLTLTLRHFEDTNEWEAQFCHRLVVPRIAET
jgi:hypothetical protein